MAALVNMRDAALAGAVPAFVLLARTVREDRLESLAGSFADVRELIRGDRAAMARAIAQILGAAPVRRSPEEIAEAYVTNRFFERLLAVQPAGRRTWHNRVRMEGREHIEAALAAGRGAVLWFADLIFAAEPLYVALADLGYGFCCLTRYNHGISQTRFGVRLLNRPELAILNRLRDELAVIGPDELVGRRKPTEALADRLAANRLVTVRAYCHGRRTVSLPFLEGRLHMATGPLALARRSGAPVIPVWSIRLEDGSTTVTVEPPLALEGDDDAAAIDRAARDFARRHEGYVVQWPERVQWHRAFFNFMDGMAAR